MAVQNYAELLVHKNHKIGIHTYSDENIAIECADCFEVLLDFDNEETKIEPCNGCESTEAMAEYACANLKGWCLDCCDCEETE